MILGSRGLRETNERPERIDDPYERVQIRRQASRVALYSAVATVSLTTAVIAAAWLATRSD